MKKHEHASLLDTAQDHPSSTVNGGCDEDTPPLPSTKVASKVSFPLFCHLPFFFFSLLQGTLNYCIYYLQKKQEQQQHPLGSLPADVLAGILSRVPYKSLCRFKCVSRPWLALCYDRNICKRCPQTLLSFFYNGGGCSKFHNLSGKGPPLVDPSLPFLREIYDCFTLEQCCGGVLLCKCWDTRKGGCQYNPNYVVCNPVTGQWAALLPPLF
jgi:hypothetical protein